MKTWGRFTWDGLVMFRWEQLIMHQSERENEKGIGRPKITLVELIKKKKITYQLRK